MKIKDFFQSLFVKKWLKIVLTIFFAVIIILLLLVISIFSYQYYYKDKVFQGVKLNQTDLSGLNNSQLNVFVNQKIDSLYKEGLVFVYQDKQVEIDPILSSAEDPGMTYDLLYFDANKIIEKALLFGRNHDFFTNLKDQLVALLFDYQVPIYYDIDSQELKKVLQANFKELETIPQDATWEFDLANNEVKIIPENEGQIFDYQKAILELEKNINIEKIKPIELELSFKDSAVTAKDLEAKKQAALDFLKNTQSITFEYIDQFGDAKKWQVDQNEIISWLIVCQSQSDLTLCFKDEKVNEKLNQIGLEINIEPQNAKLLIEDNVVKEFIPAKNGVVVDNLATKEKLALVFDRDNPISLIEIAFKESAPEISTGSTNDLGITERIGVGVSDFVGSPANRIHNIYTGLAKLNGLLIKPGEEFSTITNLLPIDAVGGYKQELVIKGNKTIPEYGGGLCQIGTTMFRVALDSGLPITERRPHSYRVSYYEPAGMDATIYWPHPDLRFVNDTGNYLLLTGYIEGTKLYFELWGTNDGRQAELTHPSVYNVTYPGATKIIETTDLAPGQKRCTESSHNGADTTFYRTITFDDDREIIEETYNSHYQAWQAVCLLGVEELITECLEGEDCTTEENIEDNTKNVEEVTE